jgi:dienelactone hydrolase
MKRRDFLKIISASTACAAASNKLLAKEKSQPQKLPERQFGPPLPELGSHWENVFEKLSANCKPKLSFLNPQFTDPKEWNKLAREKLLEHMHYLPALCNPNPQVVKTIDRGSYTTHRILINTTPDIRIPVYLLIPKGLTKPAPAVVALHDHGGFYFWGKEKLVKIEPEHPELTKFKEICYGGKSIADELAKKGFVVIASDMLHWGERALYLDADPARIKNRTLKVTKDDIAQFNARSWEHEELIGRMALLTGVTWPGIIAFDDMRVTDYLLTRPEVDNSRVGCVGLSVGSVRAIFLGALHPAVRASVPVCWMAEYQQMAKSHLYWKIGYTKLVPGLYNDLDWPDVASLHWPGALMTINGLKDRLYPLKAAKDAVKKIEKIYSKAGTPEKYSGIFFDGPHEFNLEMQNRAFDWLLKQLNS